MSLGFVASGCCSPAPPLGVSFALNIWALLAPQKGKGGPKVARFKMLKTAARNCTRKASEIFVTAKSLCAEKSTLYRFGPTMLLRPALPRRFEQLPGTLEKGTHCDAIAGVAMGTV